MALGQWAIWILALVLCGARASVSRSQRDTGNELGLVCPAGWHLYTPGGVCIHLSNQVYDFCTAEEWCHSNQGRLARVNDTLIDFVQALLSEQKTEGEFWVMASETECQCSVHSNYDDCDPGYLTRRGFHLRLLRENSIYGGSHKFICQKPAECEPGRFGYKCKTTCHCLGNDTCPITNQGDLGVCGNGCERGWVGDGCGTARRQPEGKYYCSQKDKVPAVYIGVFTNGIENITVYRKDSSNAENPWVRCTPRDRYWRLGTEPGVTAIRLRGHAPFVGPDSNSGSHRVERWTHNEDCNSGQDDHQTWLVHVWERRGVELEQDVRIEVQCHFPKSQELLVKTEYYPLAPELLRVERPSPTPISDDVALTLVDATSDMRVTSAALGRPVKLRIEFGLRPGSFLASLVPKSCKAKAVDSTEAEILLIDSEGCVAPSSPVPGFIQKSKYVLETTWFPVFHLHNAIDMHISCELSLCFENEICPEPTCPIAGNQTGTDESILDLSSTMSQLAKGTTKTACPKGWHLVPGLYHTCVYVGHTWLGYCNAVKKCEQLGGSIADFMSDDTTKDFVEDMVKKADGGSFWVKATSSDCRCNEGYYRQYYGSCIYIEKSGNDVEYSYGKTYDSNYYICQRPTDCPPGKFGSFCERECHCHGGSPCEAYFGKLVCKKGCDRGWVGDACDVERHTPRLDYYCFQDGEVRGAYIAVSTNGIENITVFRDTVSGLKRCSPRQDYWLLSASPGVSTIRLQSNSTDTKGRWTHGECPSYRIYNETWRIHVFEKEGVELEQDAMFEVKCHYQKYPELRVDTGYSISTSEQPKIERPSPTPISDDVTLTMVNATSGEVVTSADLGTPVKLRLEIKRDSFLGFVIPRSCKAMAPNSNISEILLIDSAGCVAPKSPVPGFTVSLPNYARETTWFPLFRLHQADEMYITCQLALCFENENCVPTYCPAPQSRRRRRSIGLDALGPASKHIKSQIIQVVQPTV